MITDNYKLVVRHERFEPEVKANPNSDMQKVQREKCTAVQAHTSVHVYQKEDWDECYKAAERELEKLREKEEKEAETYSILREAENKLLEQKPLSKGETYCSVLDQFNKRRAILIAAGRALKPLGKKIQFVNHKRSGKRRGEYKILNRDKQDRAGLAITDPEG